MDAYMQYMHYCGTCYQHVDVEQVTIRKVVPMYPYCHNCGGHFILDSKGNAEFLYDEQNNIVFQII